MAEADYRHPKCYANTRGGCSTKISGEHYVSHGLIRLYTFDDPEVTISHNHGYGVQHPVRPSRFVAKVLCETHNNGLSPADSAALHFATFLKGIAERWLGGNGEWGQDEVVHISGDDFQRWVLKLLVTHAAAKALSSDGERVTSAIPDEAIDLLLDRAQWPRTWGLCVAADTSNEDLKFDPVGSIEAITDWWGAVPFFTTWDKSLCGGIVDLAGIGFGLCLFDQGRELAEFDDPINPLRGSIQRPSCMVWELNGVQKRVEFSWSDDWEHKSITYTMNR